MSGRTRQLEIRRAIPIALLGAALLTLALAALPGSAGAAVKRGYALTVVARECPTYEDISANLQRNNLMESLRDLGPDTAYEAGDLMDPQVEEASQPNCAPLKDWTFTLGESYEAPEGESTEPWGGLTKVLDPFPTDLTTKASTPLLDHRGAPTGKTIAGAKTVQLTDEEARLAARGDLWIQGGTPTDPVLNQRFPGPLYGFGALRCAIDNVNGDNVEYIAYPAGVTHVFCFAYYVKPAPTSGTIVIRKELAGGSKATETFNFDGNVSYEPGGVFSLEVRNGKAAEERFFRAATGTGEPWRVRENEAVNWRLDDLKCTSRDGASTVVTSLAGAEAQITLAAGDLVTCTFVDAEVPPTGGLELRKLTEVGVGRFEYTVTPVGGGESTGAVAKTEQEGVAVDAEPSPLELAAGTYRVTEDPPSSERGSWHLESFECEGRDKALNQSIEVTIPAGGGRLCTFRNVFVPRGSITIDKVTLGGVGTSFFLIGQEGEESEVFEQTATTTEEGKAVRARGDATNHLTLGRYTIVDSPPEPRGNGEWLLRYVQCDGRALPFTQGRVEIRLTREDPHRNCTFVNVLDTEREPFGPPVPDPTPRTGLNVTKRPARQVVNVGEVFTYRITVTNTGDHRATGVHVIDQPRGPVSLVSAKAGDGTCNRQLPLICRINTIAAGASKTVTVRLRMLRAGRWVNRAVSGTASDSAVEVARAKTRAKGRMPSFHGLG